jgi:hypothetical protein
VQGCTLSIRLKPKAKRDQVTFTGGASALQIAVTSPPVDNSANDHCIALLAKRLGVPKSKLRIIKGGHCRDKVIACEGLTQEQAYRLLGGED